MAEEKATFPVLEKFLKSTVEDCELSSKERATFSKGLLSTGDRNEREVIEKMRNSVFKVAAESIEDEKAKKILAWAEELITIIDSECCDPKPFVKEAIFFPSDRSEKRLIKHLDAAKHKMLVCVFTITNNRLRDALKRAHDRGVKVTVITDDECMKHIGSDIDHLKGYGLDVVADNAPEYHMHNKFVVIDDLMLITGSFNWTSQAVAHNQENLTIVEDPKLAAMYTKYFNDLWKEFNDPPKMTQEDAAPKTENRYKKENRGEHRRDGKSGHSGDRHKNKKKAEGAGFLTIFFRVIAVLMFAKLYLYIRGDSEE